MIHPHQLLAIAGWGVILGLLFGGYLVASFLLIGSSLILIAIFLMRRQLFGVTLLFLASFIIGYSRYTHTLSHLTAQTVPTGTVSIAGTIVSDVTMLGASQHFDIL